MKLPSMKYVCVNDWISDHARARTVLHLGCVGDHSYDRQDQWQDACLHLRLARVARVLHGIDLNMEGIERLRRIVPADEGRIRYVVGDVETLSESLDGTQYECVLAGSIIEHLSNPGKMLASIREIVTADTDVIIVTPHCFGLSGFMRVAIRRKEAANPDHTCYFSISTLTELLRRYGYEPVEWCTGYGYHRPSIGWTIQTALGVPFFRLFPHLGGSLVCLARLSL